MSTEARAPGEDVEGLAKELEQLAVNVASEMGLASVDSCIRCGGPTPWMGEKTCRACQPKALNEAAATLRDLSRRLDEARAKYEDAGHHINLQVKRAEAAEAALEEARRERGAYLRAANAAEARVEVAEARVEVLAEALREIIEEPGCGDYYCGACGCASEMVDIARRALSPQPQEPATEGEEGKP